MIEQLKLILKKTKKVEETVETKEIICKMKEKAMEGTELKKIKFPNWSFL